MVRRTAEDDDWQDDWDSGDDSFDDFSDDSPGDELTVCCHYCGREIHEDALRCPYCENYISAEDAPPVRKSWFILVGTIVTLILVYWWIVH